MDSTERIEEINRRLQSALRPETLQVIDEGHLHVGHEGARDGRGHFRVLIVAAAFDGQTAIKRHRLVYGAMGELMESDIHALAIEAYSPEEL